MPFPEVSGRLHHNPASERWSNVYPYVIRYRICGDVVEILRTYHGARNLRSPRLPYAGEPLPALA